MLPVSIDIPLPPEWGVATGRSLLQKDGTGSLSREMRVCKRRGAATAPLRVRSVEGALWEFYRISIAVVIHSVDRSLSIRLIHPTHFELVAIRRSLLQSYSPTG